MNYQTYKDQFFENTRDQIEYKFVFPEISKRNNAQNKPNSFYFMNNMQVMQDLFDYEHMKLLYLPYALANDENSMINCELIPTGDRSELANNRSDKNLRKALNEDLENIKNKTLDSNQNHSFEKEKIYHNSSSLGYFGNVEKIVCKNISDGSHPNLKELFEETEQPKYKFTK